MQILDALRAAVGEKYVLVGEDTAVWSHDWTGKYSWSPLAVVRPATTQEVSAVMRSCHAAGIAVVPVGGHTGLTGGTHADNAVMVSLDRMNTIRAIKPDARIAVVEAGVVQQRLHEACEDHGMLFPMTFGARGSAQIGGMLSTNAGGSNVVRYGNTRDLCLGIEAVLPDGRIVDLMSELRKDNTGYDLKNLMIGAEGTLGLITAAVLKIVPAPKVRVTAMLAMDDLAPALGVLNALQEATGGAVDAFEYMPRTFIERHMVRIAGAREPFAAPHAVNILLEVGSTRPDDAERGDDGVPKLNTLVEAELASALERGEIADAVIAASDTQRVEMWARREIAAEITFDGRPLIDTDIALPLDRVAEFIERMKARVFELDSGAETFLVAHLGDGNIHYTVYPTSIDGALKEAVVTALEDLVNEMGGSFSAEHGIGLSKLPSMTRQKDAVALDVMRAVKQALDPSGLMNPGKVLPGSD
ncbi:FAD-binding oxidoreductase [Shimia ponticola]|uniref:FAD-binding oxidoreductase n=1 Tax=Shimia ponticola TaxID=2582893 RepID=UPI0011BFCAA9|nr:FAD-binding oxidoreductase [Shimia ponticola]